MGSIENYLWVEKYAPGSLKDMLLPDDYRSKFEEYVSKGEIPHLLLYGPPGSGKTTISKILIKELIGDPDDYLPLNGSVSTGVDVIRNTVEDFLKNPPFGKSKIKIVFIDEADYLSINAQSALRGVIEKYQKTARFIFTCNYIYRLSGALQSRFGNSYEFKRMPKEFIVRHCVSILETEGIDYSPEDLDKIISVNYPDIRKIINRLEKQITNGKLVRNDASTNEQLFMSYYNDVIYGIGEKKSEIIGDSLRKMQKLLTVGELDYISIYSGIFDDKDVPMWAKIMVNKYMGNHQNVAIPSMNLMAMVYDTISSGRKFKQLE